MRPPIPTCLLLIVSALLAAPSARAQDERPATFATDYVAIQDAVAAMLHAVDARDWGRVRAAFADTVYVDYTSLNGGEPSRQASADLVGGWEALLPGFDATQHLHGPLSVELDGDEARAVCAVTATHRLGGQTVAGSANEGDGAVWVVSGHYRMALRRSGGRWLITGLTLDTAYVAGDTSLPTRAQERASNE